MKMPALAVGGLVIGLAGGAVISGLGVKAEIVEARAQAEADSLAALDHGGGAHEQESITVELPEDLPSTEDPSASVELTGEPSVAEEVPVHPEDTAAVAPPAEDTATIDPAEAAVETLPAPLIPGSLGAAAAGGAEPASLYFSDEGSRKIAKIFAAMDPDDAAAVLIEMTDAEVTSILVRMSDRKAAPVIASFPPGRAATLTQTVLRNGLGGL